MALKRNIAANYLGRAYSIGSIYLFTPFYIKALGMESYGLIGFYSIILTIGALADIGLSASFAREAAREQNRRRLLNLLATIERTLVALTLIFALLVICAANWIAEHWFNPSATVSAEEIARSIRLMALTVVPQLAVSLYVAGLLGLQRQGLGNAVQALYVTARGGLVIPALYVAPSLHLFFVWQLAAGLVLFVVARTTLVRTMGFAAFAAGRPSFQTLQPVLRFAGGMFALTILSGINTQLDKIVVSRVFSIEEFGYYTLASTLAQLPFALVSPLMIALLPRLTEMIGTGRDDQASELFDRFSFFAAIISGMSAFALMFFANELMSLWLGRADIPDAAINVVRLLAVGGLFQAVGATSFYLGLAHGHSRTPVVTCIVALVVTVPILLIATRAMGMVGATIPWMLLHAGTFCALFLFVVRRFYPGRPWRWLLEYVAGPVFGALVAIAVGRLIANWAAAGPLLACLIAAATAMCGAMVMALPLAAQHLPRH